MSGLSSGNEPVITEFRENGGRVGGFYAHETLLLLTTIGRKSGREHTTPLSYIEEDGRLIVIGANIGSSRISDWVHNVLANPEVIVEVGGQRCRGTARLLDGRERERPLQRMREAWDAARARSPELTAMPTPEVGEIPVVALCLHPESVE